MGVQSLCSANQSYINKIGTAAKNIETDALKSLNTDFLNKNKKIIGATLVGGIAVASLVAAGRYHKINQLAQNIDFTPAKTIEEAKEFALKHLHIKNFELEDLNCANYVNEALTNFNNTSSKHKRLVSNVVKDISKEGELDCFAFTCGNKLVKGVLGINEEAFQDIEWELLQFVNNKSIDEFFEKFDKSSSPIQIEESMQNLFKKFKSGQELTFNEEVELRQFNCKYILDNDAKLYGGGASMFANMLSDEKCLKYLNDNNLPKSIKEFMSLDEKKQKKIVQQIFKNTDYKYEFKSCGPFSIIFHELGHILHKENIGSSKFNSIWRQKTLTCDEDIMNAIAEALDDKNPLTQIIMDEVSWYGAMDDLEFVAEVFAALKNGTKFCAEIMDKYIALGGVMP